jgi:hypothetical protein
MRLGPGHNVLNSTPSKANIYFNILTDHAILACSGLMLRTFDGPATPDHIWNKM